MRNMERVYKTFFSIRVYEMVIRKLFTMCNMEHVYKTFFSIRMNEIVIHYM